MEKIEKLGMGLFSICHVRMLSCRACDGAGSEDDEPATSVRYKGIQKME